MYICPNLPLLVMLGNIRSDDAGEHEPYSKLHQIEPLISIRLFF